MPSSQSQKPPSVAINLGQHAQHAQEQPWRYSFLGLMRMVAARQSGTVPIGHASRPRQESFRLGQQASLMFAPREVASVKQEADKLVIRLFGLGLLGPNGPLPLHYTEQVRERVELQGDTTLADFLDIFHHRFLTLFYRAWVQSQSTAGLDDRHAERFTHYIARIGGDEADQTSSHLPEHARWASVAHRVREARNPDGLVSTLQRYFGIAVALHEYQLHWIAVDEPDHCRLGWARMSSMLGQGALAGEMVPDRQTRFRLVLGPLRLDQYLRFTPQNLSDDRALLSRHIAFHGQQQAGKDLPALIEWVRAFIGYEYVWEVELLVDTREAPSAILGGPEKLGWSAWLGDSTQGNTLHQISGMVFEPENYVGAHRVNAGAQAGGRMQ